MDEVFGRENFITLVTVTKTTSATADYLAGVADYLLLFAKDANQTKFRNLWIEARESRVGYRWVQLADGTQRSANALELGDESVLPLGARLYKPDNITSQRPPGSFPVEFQGRTFVPKTSYWKTGEIGMQRLKEANRLHAASNSIQYVRYKDDFPYRGINNVWTDMSTGNFTEDKVYVVQTAVKLIERCMLMTTDPGDLILDPTCGSGTTAYVAEQWGRRWITIDTSRVALALARQRLMGSRFPWYLLSDSAEGRNKESELTGQQLPLAEVGGDVRNGFVYQRVQHITLRSIANNPDIKEGMSREQVDEATRRHAEFELLYDKPYEDSNTVRVSGPFTVESLSPHRSLAFAGSASEQSTEMSSERRVALDKDSSFEDTVIANLRIAGIQNGRRGERLTFDTIEPYASPHIQWMGERADATDGAPKRVGVTIGPQYGTVGPSFIKDAAREAIHAADLDLLCVLAFAFEPQVVGTGDEYRTSAEGFANVAAERQLGRVPVLLVRMNADLVMGEELKKTGAGNLFTVFGEPDIEVVQERDDLRVVLKGVDVYDPNSGQVRSNDVDQVALWMIDTAYNEESFFVRQCYFTGGQDPYARLKRALKADIDEEAWASLNKTESRPFPKPETGKIAVKVINDYGDEVMKIFAV
jgi:adenine-specific DNA-methyltransferase